MRRGNNRRVGLLAAPVVAGFGLVPLAGAPAAAVPNLESSVFINELHYDNAGTDTGEFLEVAGPAGTALTGWTLVLYNGSNSEPYGTTALSGTIPDENGGYGTVAVTYPSNGLQNGSPDGVALVDWNGEVIQFLSYEGTITAEAGPADGLTSTDIEVDESSSTPPGSSLQLQGEGSFYGDFSWATGDSSVDAPNTDQTFTGEGVPPEPAPPCGDPDDEIELISDIQGTGERFSAGCGGVQTVEAVVTAVQPGLDGFYLQEEREDWDKDADSSEGIFVYTGRDAITVEVGQLVRLTGTVEERVTSGSSQTQIVDPTVDAVLESGLTVEPLPVELPTDFEPYEGMLVELVDTLVISEYFNYDRFGEVVLALPPHSWDRLHTPTAVRNPGASAQALLRQYEGRTITLDDANSEQNPDVVPHPGNGELFTADNTFRGGDTVTGVTGVIDESFGVYRLQPTEYGEYTVENPRPTEAPDVGGTLQVASFNVLNYFLTLDQGPDICGPDENLECRGADTQEEFERQRAKILAALAEMDAEIVGLMEMENTTGVEPAADIVAGLNEMLGAGTYDYIDTGVIGTDAIRVGIIYQPAEVQPVGEFEILDSTDNALFDDELNRPMLTQTFEELATGEVFTVSVNHLKSKGSACDDGSDPDSGAGNCDITRTNAAIAIAEFLASDPTDSGDPDHLIIGDLNSYDEENPIDVLVKAGYVDLIRKYEGKYAYSYVFDGMVGYLDHALASRSLVPQVTGAAEWHINADEPDIIDYDMSFKSDEMDALYEETFYRSSDHDPVLVGLDLETTPQFECRPRASEQGQKNGKGGPLGGCAD